MSHHKIARQSIGKGVQVTNKLNKTFFQNVCIDLRGCDIGMPKHLLHRAEIGAVLQQMACKCMAENVRRNRLGGQARARSERFQFAGENLPGKVT
jgi:hypothetical protein